MSTHTTPAPMSRKTFVSLAALACVSGLAGCMSWPEPKPTLPETPDVPTATTKNEFQALELNHAGWNYDKEHNCFYQLAIPYCLNPASKSYMSLSIFVPGSYFVAKQQGDTWSCEPNEKGAVGDFTIHNAPFVMPLNSAYFTPQLCPTSYDYEGIRRYLQAGFIYVYAGFRGRSSGFESDKKEVFSGGAPWSVVDLKSAIRYLRYNAKSLPGNINSIVAMGYGAGATIASVLAASGDSDLYTPYLKAVGAATCDANGNTLSDAIQAAALWCPLTDSAFGNTGYEWLMGQFVEDASRARGSWKQALSHLLAARYAQQLKGLGLHTTKGAALTLDQTQDGSFVDGSYYAYVMDTLVSAATDFFAHTQFPYTQTPSRLVEPAFPGNPSMYHVPFDDKTKADAAGSASANKADGAPAPDAKQDGKQDGKQGAKQDGKQDAKQPAAAPAQPQKPADGQGISGVQQVQSVVFENPQSYIASLNKDGKWLTYSASRGTVRITSLWDFVRHCRRPSKAVCAFDAIDKSTPTNQFFGIDNESTLHYDDAIAQVLREHQQEFANDKSYSDKIAEQWHVDIAKLDSLKQTMATRRSMMDPLYHLCSTYEGYTKAHVAPYWRINTGLTQTATTLTCELNLVAALSTYSGIAKVDFTPVWDKGFELCERSGNAQDNAIAWIQAAALEIGRDNAANASSGDSSSSESSDNSSADGQ